MKEFKITITIEDGSEHDPIAVFEQVQMLCLDEFGGEVGAFFGDDLANGDEVLDRAIQNLMPSPFENTEEQ